MNSWQNVKSTALAAIANPLDEAGKEIFEFYSTAYRNLGMEKRQAVPKDSIAPKDAFVAYQEGTLGPILGNSPLVAMRLDDELCVYGITRFGYPNWKVAKLSPAFSTEDLFETQVLALAGTGDGKQQGWLYEIESDTSGQKVVEHGIGSAKVEFETPAFKIGSQSQISAFYDRVNDQRYVVYQGTDGSIKYRAMESGKDWTVPSSDKATVGTPMAACSLSGTVYIFYLQESQTKGDTKTYLNVTSGPISKPTDEPTEIKQQVSPSSFLTLVPMENKAKKCYDIHVYFVNGASGGGGKRDFAHYCFPTKSPIEEPKTE